MNTEQAHRVRRPEVRRRILAAAAREFADRGIQATRLEDVAAAAGFTRGAVYSNFAGKDDLVAAVIADRVDAMTGLGIAATPSCVDELPAIVGAFLAGQVRADRGGHQLAMETMLHASRDDATRERVLGPRRALRATVADWLRSYAEQAGVTLPMSADLLAVTLIALVDGIATECLADRGQQPLEALRQAVRCLLPAPVRP